MTMREIEQRAIERSMTRHNGNKKAVADELGMSLKTLYNKLNAASEASEAA
jgi:two-component system NtrC family response regulator